MVQLMTTGIHLLLVAATLRGVGPVRGAAEGPQPADGSLASEVTVALTPDRAEWGFRQTITGSIAITNTGKKPAIFSAWWIDAVGLQGPDGKEAHHFSILGCILRDPSAPTEIVLEPGQQHTGTFSVYTDRMYGLRNGYYAKPGKWFLSYPAVPMEDLRVTCRPVPVEIVLKAGEYAGPRIMEVRGHASNLTLEREDSTIEVFDVATGQRRASRSLRGYERNFGWFGAQLVFSSDARLVAVCPERERPIHVEALYGDPPARSEIRPPPSLDVGPGGFVPVRFSPDDATVFCTTNGKIVTVDLASGAAVRTVSAKEIWPRVSPDGLFGGVVHGSLMRIVGHRGDDAYRVAILDLDNPKLDREVGVAGHGPSPELHMGVAGAYLCDEFAHSTVLVRYDGQPREFKTDAPAEFIGESPDGSLFAVAWPWSEHGQRSDPTTVGVYRVADGSRLCTIDMDEPRTAVLVSDPARIISLPRRIVGGACDGGHWSAETATVHNALTGELIGSIDLTPAPGPLTQPFAK